MAKSGKKGGGAAIDTKNVDNILEKYRKVRQRRNKSDAAWSGPSHQKFSQYFEDSSSDSVLENKKLLSPSALSEEDNHVGSESSTEAMSDSDDSLILPTRKEVTYRSAQKLEKLIGFSDSEPEDPEQEKILQEKLKERRSRVGNPNPANISAATRFHNNRTLNTTSNKSKFLPTRLSEVSPNLLDLSSSNDEDEIPFTRKIVEPNIETEPNSSFLTPSKRKPRDEVVEFAVPEVNHNDIDTMSDEFVNNHELETTPVAQEISKSEVKVSPKKFNVNEEHTKAKKRSVSGAVKNLTFQGSPDKEVTFTVDENVRPSTGSSKKRLHVSTPKPKDLPASKLLNNSKRRSYNSGTAKKRAAAVAKMTETKVSPNKRASAPASSAKFLKTKPRDSVAAEAQPVATTSNDVPLQDNLSHVVTPTHLEEANITSKKASDVSNISKKQSAKRKSKSSAQGDKRVLRSSLPRASPVPEPVVDSPPTSSSTNIDTNPQTVTRDPPAAARAVESSTDAPVTTETRTIEMTAASRFVASSRLASDEDPVQSYIIHQTPTLFTIMWKLLPDVCNWARTRGQTCILVFEGEIEVENQVYPRGHVVKLASGTTYLVKNVGKSIALFQVAEYL